MFIDPDETPSNSSGNRPFTEVLEARLSRRSVIGGALGAVTVGFLAPAATASAAPGAVATTRSSRRSALGFTAVPTSSDDTVGMHHDGMATMTQEKVDKALAAHGVTVVELRRAADGTWSHVQGSRYNRRVTGDTPMRITGAVTADHSALQTGTDPRGTLNNCSVRPRWTGPSGSPRTRRRRTSTAPLTNGSGGGAVNPRIPNPYAHIIRWREDRGDQRSTTFRWDIYILAGDPAYDPQVAINGDIFGSPDGLYFDADGRMWIETDISNGSQNLASRGYDNIGNNMLLASDPATKEVRRFLTAPRGSEVTGCVMTPDRRTLFINIQHPGESTRARGAPMPEDPRAVSNWPDFDPAGRPRPATVAIRRVDGGVIGA